MQLKTSGIDESLQDEHLTASTHSQIVTCDRLEFQTVEVSVGAKTSEHVLMPDYEPTERVSENTDNGHNLIDMAIIDLEPYAGTDGNVHVK